MKRLSDYQNEEAMELWADLLEPIGRIVQDEAIRATLKDKSTPIVIAKEILKLHSDDAVEILLRIDPTPITGLNIILRLVGLIEEFAENEDLKGFFGFAETQTVSASSGSVTANTEDAEA